jgi:hypothetical protein
MRKAVFYVHSIFGGGYDDLDAGGGISDISSIRIS